MIGQDTAATAMAAAPSAAPAEAAGPAAIEVQGFAKSYGAVQAVKGISFSVAQGEIFGFLGPNGAGKSTTIRAMLDFIRPTAGTIRLLGLDAQRDTRAIHRRRTTSAGATIDWHWLLLTQLAAGAFLLLALGLGAVISACTSVARTAGSAAIGVLVLGYLLNSLATLSDRLTWMTYLSPFHYADLSAILVQHQITWWYLVLLSGLGVAGVIAGLIVFERRDLAA
jgi:ABC transporter/ABC-2 family transporter protein